MNRTYAYLGATCAGIGCAIAATLFFPVLEAVDEGGGDEPINLLASLVLGLIGGIVASPVAMACGGLVGWKLQDRPIGVVLSAALIALGAVLSVVPWLALGATSDPDDRGFLFAVAALGGLAAVLAIVLYRTLTKRWLALRDSH